MQRIAIHSVPRSGSTWLGEIFNSNENCIYKFQPLFSYSFKGRLTPSSNKKEIQDFFNELAISKDAFLDQTAERKSGLSPSFIKKTPTDSITYKEVRYHHILENLLIQDKEIKIIGLIRNPLSTINSWLKAPKEFRKDLGWKIEEEWYKAPKKNQKKKEEFYGFNKWKEVAHLFLALEKKHPDNFKIVNYADLINNTKSKVEELFSFCNLPMTNQTLEFIKQSKTIHKKGTYSVFRKRNNDSEWSNHLPDEIVSTVKKELKNTNLEIYLNE